MPGAGEAPRGMLCTSTATTAADCRKNPLSPKAPKIKRLSNIPYNTPFSSLKGTFLDSVRTRLGPIEPL